jgi:hypothetical protein
MQKVILYSSIFCLALFLVACKKNYIYESVIVNNTSKNIQLSFYTKFRRGNASSPSTPPRFNEILFVGANKQTTVAQETEDGEPIRVFCVDKSIAVKGDSVVAFVDSTTTLRKLIDNEDQWTTDQNSAKNTYRCLFTIENADIR